MSGRRLEIFVSATSADLRSIRQAACQALRRLGYHPVEQTDFPPDYRTVRTVLREQIQGCDFLIHIAGECYGTEPNPNAAEGSRRSYAQLEYDMARALGKLVYVFVCGANFPYDPHAPEEEERDLQAQHRAVLTGGEAMYVPVTSDNELKECVRELRLPPVHSRDVEPLQNHAPSADSTQTDNQDDSKHSLTWWLR